MGKVMRRQTQRWKLRGGLLEVDFVM